MSTTKIHSPTSPSRLAFNPSQNHRTADLLNVGLDGFGNRGFSPVTRVPSSLVIEKHFEISFVANLALREKQVQQNYRPIIAVHKWFARRPGTLFRSLLLSEFCDRPLQDAYFEAHDLRGLKVADPFMGGGTPILEANRLGCEVIGHDINPMAWWIVREQLDHIDLSAYRQAAAKLRTDLRTSVGDFYVTRCIVDGNRAAPVKYFLWVKVTRCSTCQRDIDLFPGYVLAEAVRHPRNVVVCHACGDLNDVDDLKNPGDCAICHATLRLDGPISRTKMTCLHCGKEQRVPSSSMAPYRRRLFALEYINPSCLKPHHGRFFKKVDAEDLARVAEAGSRLSKIRTRFVPDDIIPKGDETDRLLRWGYQRYRELFNERQLLGLEISARLVAAQSDPRILHALATNFSDLLRYQNTLCRYDTMALKSLDIFSVHGFPVRLVEAESNLLGIENQTNGSVVGSGGWFNITEKYARAKEYCDSPFEIRCQGNRKTVVPIRDEWIGECRNGRFPADRREVTIECRDSAACRLKPASLDAVVTDPPYFGNVQYAELMDFCYVWLRRLVGDRFQEFAPASTRSSEELTGNVTLGRDLAHFTEGLSEVFQRMAVALKPGRPLAFTFHHNSLDAYAPLAVAILDAGMTCSATLPCPAEMGGSIHIHGTLSSIIDTVFVCRTHGSTPRRLLTSRPEELAGVVRGELEQLRAGSVKPTRGDARCIIAGHLARLAVWQLRHDWDRTITTVQRLSIVQQWFAEAGGIDATLAHVESDGRLSSIRVCEDPVLVSENVSF